MDDRLKQAILEFRSFAKYAKSLHIQDGIWIGHMADSALSHVLLFMVEERTTVEILQYLDRATDSFRAIVRKHKREKEAG